MAQHFLAFAPYLLLGLASYFLLGLDARLLLGFGRGRAQNDLHAGEDFQVVLGTPGGDHAPRVTRDNDAMKTTTETVDVLVAGGGTAGHIAAIQAARAGVTTSIIEAGQVFTIEPGIYFIPSLLDDLQAGPYSAAIDWRLVHALAELGGVRIEDDLFVTGGPDTVRNLTRESFGAA